MSDVDQAEPSKSRLPSPGCLFAITLLVMLASVCFWMGGRVHQQRTLVEYFEEIGATVETEPASPVWLHDLVMAILGEEYAVGFTDVTIVYMNDTQVTDRVLHRLSGLSELYILSLNNTHLTDDDLQHLSRLTNLQILALNSTDVTDAGLRHLNSLTNLKDLYLVDTRVTDAGADELRSQLPQASVLR